jgi:hypothetical protein
LEAADVVIYDDLGAQEALALAPAAAERVYVGKRGGRPSIKQPEIDRLLVDKTQQARARERARGRLSASRASVPARHCLVAFGLGFPAQRSRGALGAVDVYAVSPCLSQAHPSYCARARRAAQGLRVVRLKGGCPSVFSRVSSELRALAAAGCAAELVPGVSSALAAPLFAGAAGEKRTRVRRPVSSARVQVRRLLYLSFEALAGVPGRSRRRGRDHATSGGEAALDRPSNRAPATAELPFWLPPNPRARALARQASRSPTPPSAAASR